MSGRGESPEEIEEEADEEMETLDLSFGQTLYTEDGVEVGQIRGLEESGVYVTTREGAEAFSIEHARSGHSFGAAELMWRCTNCGEMGEIEEGLPEECPNCSAPREDLMYWTED